MGATSTQSNEDSRLILRDHRQVKGSLTANSYY